MAKKSRNHNLPIGVFDSGMGGLTVLRELSKVLPNESFIYLGDTARLPYGTKSAETVRSYAKQMANILVNQDIKLLVVACNTASAAALPYLEEQFPEIPMVGVIKPGAQAAIEATKNNIIAVLATEATVASGVYEKTIQDINADACVLSESCGLFVALAEEACIDDDIALATVNKYIKPIVNNPNPCDCVLLGCTHFPVFEELISRVLGDKISVINSAKATATAVDGILEDLQLRSDKEEASLHFLVTDLPERFIRVGEIFLGCSISPNLVLCVDSMHHDETPLFQRDGDSEQDTLIQ